MLPWHCNENFSYPGAPLSIGPALRSNAGSFVVKLSYVCYAPSEGFSPNISKEKYQLDLDVDSLLKKVFHMPKTFLNILPAEEKEYCVNFYKVR